MSHENLILKLCFLSRTHGDLVSGLYHQILLSLQKVLSDPVRPLCSHYGAVVGLHALGWKVSSLLQSVNFSNLVFLLERSLVGSFYLIKPESEHQHTSWLVYSQTVKYVTDEF